MHRTYSLATPAFPRVRRLILQKLNMPDDSWNTSGKEIPLRRPFEIFVPNVYAIDMDTTARWPFGRRLEDQVATRFLSLFLDIGEAQRPAVPPRGPGRSGALGRRQIEPKTPPNPLEERQGVSQGVPLPGRTVVIRSDKDRHFMRVVTAALLLLGVAASARGLTDYEAEIRQIEESVAAIQPADAHDPSIGDAAAGLSPVSTRHAHRKPDRIGGRKDRHRRDA